MSTQPPETHERAIAAERSLMLATHARWARIQGRHVQAMRFALAGWYVAAKADAVCAPEVEAELAAAASASAWVADLVGSVGYREPAQFSPDGTRILTVSHDGTARVWSAKTGEVVQVLPSHGGSVYSAAFSPDGTMVLTTSADASARVWDVESGTQLAAMPGDTAGVPSAWFNPDSSQVLTVSEIARLWCAKTGTVQRVFDLPGGGTSVACFSPDGGRISFALASHTVVVRVDDGAILFDLSGHDGEADGLAFSADGCVPACNRDPVSGVIGA